MSINLYVAQLSMVTGKHLPVIRWLLGDELGGGTNFSTWYHSTRALPQNGFDTLVQKAVDESPRRLSTTAELATSLNESLLEAGLAYLGNGDINDPLKGESTLGIPDGVVMPSLSLQDQENGIPETQEEE